MTTPVDPDDQRRFPRLQAPVYCRPMGLRIFQDRQQPINISLGGARVYSDNYLKNGTRLEIELFLPDTSSIVCEVEVVWITRMPDGAAARYDVGLHFTRLQEADIQRLAAVLHIEG